MAATCPYILIKRLVPAGNTACGMKTEGVDCETLRKRPCSGIKRGWKWEESGDGNEEENDTELGGLIAAYDWKMDNKLIAASPSEQAGSSLYKYFSVPRSIESQILLDRERSSAPCRLCNACSDNGLAEQTGISSATALFSPL